MLPYSLHFGVAGPSPCGPCSVEVDCTHVAAALFNGLNTASSLSFQIRARGVDQAILLLAPPGAHLRRDSRQTPVAGQTKPKTSPSALRMNMSAMPSRYPWSSIHARVDDCDGVKPAACSRQQAGGSGKRLFQNTR